MNTTIIHEEPRKASAFGPVTLRGELEAAKHRQQVLQAMLRAAKRVTKEFQTKLDSMMMTGEEIERFIHNETDPAFKNIWAMPREEQCAPFDKLYQFQIFHQCIDYDAPRIWTEFNSEVADDVTFVAGSPMLSCWMDYAHWLQEGNIVHAVKAATAEILRRQSIGFC
jgi:soluble cytochrome b562